MTEQDLNSLKIDKTKWKPVKFGQVVFEPKENAKDFLAEGIERVVGLEHIESENIHLTNSASAQEGTTFTKKFSIDDVLFGRRRAYLKKAAQAKFSGVCSGDIIVMRAQKDKLMPELLPFIVNNDKFFDYAITHSAGGLSPRVKFKDLANYEFLLPPKEQQAELAELLWAMDSLLQYSLHVLDRLNVTQASLRKEHFISVKGQNRVLLGDHAKVRAGYGFPIKYQGYLNKEVMFFKVGDMNKPENLRFLTFSDNTISMEEALTLKAKLHPAGTVVFPKVGAAIATEKKRLLLKDSLIDNNVMGVIVDHPASIPPTYLLEIFEFLSLKSLSNNGAVPSINAETINNIAFNLPTKEVIELFLCKMDSLYSLIDECKLKIEQDQTFLKVITNQVF